MDFIAGRRSGGDKLLFGTVDLRPWPTYMQGMDRDDEPSLTLVVAGKPEPPLSLAFVVNGGGSTVEVPILIEKIAVRGK